MAVAAIKPNRKRISPLCGNGAASRDHLRGGPDMSKKGSGVADFDEGEMPTCAPFVAAVAEPCAAVAGCAPFDLLDPFGRNSRLKKRAFDAMAQVEVRLCRPRRIVGCFRTEQRAKFGGQLGRDFVTAPTDARSDRGEHLRRVRSRRVLKGANGAPGNPQPRASPTRVHRRRGAFGVHEDGDPGRPGGRLRRRGGGRWRRASRSQSNSYKSCRYSWISRAACSSEVRSTDRPASSGTRSTRTIRSPRASPTTLPCGSRSLTPSSTTRLPFRRTW